MAILKPFFNGECGKVRTNDIINKILIYNPMTLEATHIRFAVDLMNEFNIQDIAAYVSGTIYPDSRYITKIDRGLAHDKKYLENSFATDDFKKGWRVHLICDEIQGKYIAAITNTQDKIVKQSDITWIELTAIKVLQEIEDLKSFDVSKYLQYSKIFSIPNNEDRELLGKYYEFVKKFYSQGDLQIENYRTMFDVFGIPKDIEDKVIEECMRIQKDELKMKEIKNLHSQITAEAMILLNSL